MKQPPGARRPLAGRLQTLRHHSLSFLFLFAVVAVLISKQYRGRVVMAVDPLSGVAVGGTVHVLPGASVTEDASLPPPSQPPGGWNQQVPVVVVVAMEATSSLPVEFATITSKETLSQVIGKHNLVDRWKLASLEEACVKLSRMIAASGKRGTDHIEIEVRGPDRNEAAALANAVALAYTDRRQQLATERR